VLIIRLYVPGAGFETPLIVSVTDDPSATATGVVTVTVSLPPPVTVLAAAALPPELTT
jgi:hypothetical protein